MGVGSWVIEWCGLCSMHVMDQCACFLFLQDMLTGDTCVLAETGVSGTATKI